PRSNLMFRRFATEFPFFSDIHDHDLICMSPFLKVKGSPKNRISPKTSINFVNRNISSTRHTRRTLRQGRPNNLLHPTFVKHQQKSFTSYAIDKMTVLIVMRNTSIQSSGKLHTLSSNVFRT